jgi:oligopeptide/dipeptide ABC transporter ATP-binding protein
MYAGRVVETGTVEQVLLDPRHPYARGLLASIPSRGKKGRKLSAIRGVVPNPFRMPEGCKFAPRCPYAWDTCSVEEPALIDLHDGRTARCWLHDPRFRSRLSDYDADEPAGVA